MTRSTPPKRILGERLKRLRRARGFGSARDFAAAIGISENTYGRYERGETVPKLDVQQRICAELGVTPTDLYGWHDREVIGSGRSRSGTESDQGSDAKRAGMAEEGFPQSLEPPPSDRALRESAAWNLAEDLLSTKLRSAAHEGEDKRPGTWLQDIARLAIDLVREPLVTIARVLESIKFDRLPSGEEARLAKEIAAFLAVLASKD